MSPDFLSQDEVDALLKGVTGEVDEAPTEESSAGIKSYDLGRQERIVRGRMPTLELFNERFARLFRIGLFNYMHRTAEIAVGPVRVQKYSEFVRNLVVPTNLNLVQMKPLRGTALVIFDPNLVCIPGHKPQILMPMYLLVDYYWTAIQHNRRQVSTAYQENSLKVS